MLRLLHVCCAGPVPGIGGRRDKVALEEPVVEQSSLIINTSCHCIVKV